MFDDSQRRVYHRITPSPDLKKRIMQMQQKPSVTSPPIWCKAALVTAACFVVIFITVFSFVRQPHFLIEMDGIALSENPTTVATQNILYQPNTRTISLYQSETAAVDAVPLHITAKSPTTVSVSGGFLLCADANTEQILQKGTDCTIDKTTTVYWAIADCLQEQSYTMTIKEKDTVFVLSLQFNTQTKQWELTLNQ